MREVIKAINDDIVRISSREVASMMGIEHKSTLRKIDGFNNIFSGNKIVPTKYWVEGEYLDSQNKKQREFLVSKEGCEFIANKSTGENGVIFTHKYMEKFKKMEEQIKNMTPQITEKEQMLLKLFSKNPAEVAQAHNRIVEIEVEEATAPLLETIEQKDETLNIAVKDSKLFTIGDVGKLLKPYNKDLMGAKKLFVYLRDNKILMNSPNTDRHNMHYDKFSEYFESKFIKTFKDGTGYKTYLNGKGVKWLLGRLVKEGIISYKDRNNAENDILYTEVEQSFGDYEEIY